MSGRSAGIGTRALGGAAFRILDLPEACVHSVRRGVVLGRSWTARGSVFVGGQCPLADEQSDSRCSHISKVEIFTLVKRLEVNVDPANSLRTPEAWSSDRLAGPSA